MSRAEKKIPVSGNKLQLHIFFDHSIAEVFVNDGEAVFTSQFFIGETEKNIELFSTGGTTQWSNIHFWEMKSAW
jgi:sucrose-6-phosphate hydrolase SacC (GH32 family)